VREAHDCDVQVLGNVLLQEPRLGLILLVGVVDAPVRVEHPEVVHDDEPTL
jgi:hypothetical protein